MKRMIGMLLTLALLCPCLALAEAAGPRTEAGRQVAGYLDEAGVNYRLDTSTEEDVFIRTFVPSAAESLEAIVVGAYVDDEGTDIMTATLTTPDTSDMLNLYRLLEAVNEDASFVRFIYSPDDGSVYARMELPFVDDGNYGYVVERYMFLTALAVDENYNALAELA